MAKGSAAALSDSPAFEDWALVVRERLQRQVLSALAWLSQHYAQQGDLERAWDRAARRVELAPWEEGAHRQLMRLLARSGRRSEALAQYKACREMLAEVIREYFLVCDRMSDFILLIYQESQSLPAQWQKRVLENELRITGLFVEVLARLASSGELPGLEE